MANGIVELNTATFEETVGSSDTPVVVDFWAEWCGPCKQIAPVLQEISDEHSEHLTIAKLNVDENPDIAMKFNVMSIPTLLVFDGGEVSKRLVGAKGKRALLEELDEFLVTSHGPAVSRASRYATSSDAWARPDFRRPAPRPACSAPRPRRRYAASRRLGGCTPVGSATSRPGWH
jgi:thioredoxin 1